MERGTFGVVVLSVAAAVAGSDPDRTVPEFLTRPAFDLQVAVPPAPVVVMGTAYLVYELHLTNFARQAVVLARVEVVDADVGGSVLAEFVGGALELRLNPPAAAAAGNTVPASASAIDPGVRRVLYLEVPLRPGASPAALEHRVTYRTTGADPGADDVVQGGRVPVAAEPPVSLGPPLRGGPWAALHQPCWQRGHRRVRYAVDGRARIPGRFAMDWTRLDAEGLPSRGDADVVANWYAHGAEVLAVADGTVAATRTDVPESATFSNRLEHSPDEAEGNFISLDLGGGRYAFYGHLRTGSITVAPGERVRRGQVMGQVGFTGQAGRPQLHFHVGDAIASNGSEGHPFVFDAFNLLGGYGPGDAQLYGSRDHGCVDAVAAMEGLASIPWTPLTGETDAHRTGEMPAPNAVVEFP